MESYGSYLKSIKKKWTITPKIFVSLLDQYVLQADLLLVSGLSWGELMIDSFLQECKNYLPVSSTLVSRLEFLVGHQTDFSMFNDISKWCLQQQYLTIRLWSLTNNLCSSRWYIMYICDPFG